MNRKSLPGVAMPSTQKLREPGSSNEQPPSRSCITLACYRREEAISVRYRLRSLSSPNPHARVNTVERQFSTLDQVNECHAHKFTEADPKAIQNCIGLNFHHWVDL